MTELPKIPIPDFEEWGVSAFTTTREAGSFSLAGAEPVGEVIGRWSSLQSEIGRSAPRLVTVRQVHGSHVVQFGGGWEGWLRDGEADGQITLAKGTALATTVADCVPVFIAHPSGAVALLHSGWRGTVARITEAAVAQFGALGMQASDLAVHLGPAICGRCYEVSADVRGQLTGETANRAGNVDLRSLIAGHARAAGVKRITVSEYCTRCDNDRLYSHRAADAGRQLGVIFASA